MSGLTKDDITRAHEACLTEYKKLCLECVSEQDYQIGWMDCTRSQADRLRTADELEKASWDLETWAGCKCDAPGCACDCDFGPILIRYHRARAAYLKARDTK